MSSARKKTKTRSTAAEGKEEIKTSVAEENEDGFAQTKEDSIHLRLDHSREMLFLGICHLFLLLLGVCQLEA